MVTTRRRGRNAIQTKTTTSSFLRGGEEENGFTNEEDNEKVKVQIEGTRTKGGIGERTTPRKKDNDRNNDENKNNLKIRDSNAKSLQLDRDERFEEEHEPFLFGPPRHACRRGDIGNGFADCRRV